MSKKYNHPLMAKATSHNGSGIAFIGSVKSDFHMIIRCPIHVYCVIKKAIDVFEEPVKTSFYSGSMPITDLALSKYVGTFLYISPTGKKCKYNAAFIYPVKNVDDYDYIRDAHKILQVLDNNNWSYYEKETCRPLRTILSQDFSLPLLSDYFLD